MKRQDFINGISAGYAFMYASTYEMTRCMEEISEMVREANEGIFEGDLKLKVWDCESKVKPDEILREIDDSTPWTICILKNYNWFLYDKRSGKQQNLMVQFLQNREDIYTSTETRKIVVIVSDAPFSSAIPPSIEKIFLPLDFGLPGRSELSATLDSILESAKEERKDFPTPTDDERDDIISSLKSMTVQEAKQALSFSAIAHGRFDPNTLQAIRDKCLEKIAGIKAIDTSNVDPDKIKGMNRLKRRTLKAIMGKNRHKMKGFMLLGPPGTGKTTFFKWLSKVTGIKLYMVEVAELFGSLVGESEKLMKALLDIIPLLSPAIIVFDEIEKMIEGGMSGGSKGDSGTTRRSIGQLLKFMSDDRPDDIHIFATCNDRSGIDPEWVRPGRWDTSAWFIDLPDAEERKEILSYYMKAYGVEGKPPKMDGWSGAEIEALCHNAMLQEETIGEVADLICPISITDKEKITALREWAKGRTIPASEAIEKNADGEITKKKKRAVRM